MNNVNAAGMKPKIRGWKEGVLKEDLKSVGGTILKKGSIVRYRRFKVYETETGYWTGEYEWHYLDQNNFNLIRESDLLIEK